MQLHENTQRGPERDRNHGSSDFKVKACEQQRWKINNSCIAIAKYFKSTEYSR